MLDPWELVWGQPYIDTRTLAGAIEQDLERNTCPDFRTRLLVRDAVVAMRAFWGPRLEKHQTDLRVLALKLDKDTARRRLLADGRAFLDDPKLRPRIEENWRFIFQEPLCLEQPEKPVGEGTRVDKGQRSRTPRPSRPKRSGRKRR